MSERVCGCEVRSESCVCGGMVTVTPASGIETAVRDHQASRQHRAWRDRGGLQGELDAMAHDSQYAAWLVTRETLQGQAA